MGKKKEPKTSVNTGKSKQPTRVENPDSYLGRNPTWKFGRLDLSHVKWSIRDCCDFNKDILGKLVDFERQTWDEIAMNKKNHHHIGIISLSRDAQQRLEELHIYDDQIFSLRLGGKLRLFGILEDGVFYIIWYDQNHEICPSILKHT